MKFEFMDFNINEGLFKLSEDKKYQKLEEKVFDKFYRYTGIKPGTKITDADIHDYWLSAIGKIGFEEGLTSEGLTKILLNKCN